MLKKKNLVSIIGALGGAAGYEAYRHLKKKHKSLQPFFPVTTATILASTLADRFLPEDEPFTHEAYLKQVAARNQKRWDIKVLTR